MKRLYVLLTALAVTAGAAFGLVEGVFTSSAAQAAGTKFYSVPGVINSTNLATVFSCTNGNTTPASVTVSLFNKAGTAGPTGTSSIAAHATWNFETQPTAAIPPDLPLGAGLMLSGSAQISAPAGVYCTAIVTDIGHDPPTSMVSLPVISGTKQKGV